MNDNSSPTPRTPAPQGGRRRPLYRTVLSLAVAAVIAASIPFAAIYTGTVRQASSLVAQAPAALPGSKQSTRLITTASGRQIRVPAGAGATAGSAAQVAAQLTTRASSLAGGDN